MLFLYWPHLPIPEKPKILLGNKEIEVSENDTAIIECEVEGSDVEVAWVRTGKEVKTTGKIQVCLGLLCVIMGVANIIYGHVFFGVHEEKRPCLFALRCSVT